MEGKRAVPLRSLLDASQGPIAVDAGADEAHRSAADDASHAPQPAAAFDHIVAMDLRNQRDMERMGIQSTLLLDFADPVEVLGEREIPDPFLEGGFDLVYRLVDAGCRGLLASILEDEGWD